jgi:hypothetical protein
MPEEEVALWHFKGLILSDSPTCPKCGKTLFCWPHKYIYRVYYERCLRYDEPLFRTTIRIM